jgi:hypothetical protein
MMREGSDRVPAFSRRGENLQSLAHAAPHLEGHSQSCQIENTPDIQIEHLLTAPVWRGFKRATPGRTCIAHQDIQLSTCLLANLLRKLCNLLGVCDIGSDTDSFARDGKFVELLDGLVDTLRSFVFARTDEDFRCAREEEGGCGMKTKTSRSCEDILLAANCQGQEQEAYLQ